MSHSRTITTNTTTNSLYFLNTITSTTIMTKTPCPPACFSCAQQRPDVADQNRIRVDKYNIYKEYI